MLRVPEDFAIQSGESAFSAPEVTLIDYEASSTVLSEPVLVTQPTFVLVRAGTKQLQPQGDAGVLTARASSILAMRAGTHVMSEFRSDGSAYRSLIVSIPRAFVREAVGLPASTTDAPRVVVSTPPAHTVALFERLPDTLRSARDDGERQFLVRELLVALTGDRVVRDLVFDEALEWGNSVENRLASIVRAHCLSPVQVPDLAELCAMSLSSFKRHFHAVFGAAPGKWLTSTRLAHARSMVRNGTASVTEISRASGYREVSSFIRAFRREFRTTPTEMRRADHSSA